MIMIDMKTCKQNGTAIVPAFKIVKFMQLVAWTNPKTLFTTEEHMYNN